MPNTPSNVPAVKAGPGEAVFSEGNKGENQQPPDKATRETQPPTGVERAAVVTEE